MVISDWTSTADNTQTEAQCTVHSSAEWELLNDIYIASEYEALNVAELQLSAHKNRYRYWTV